MHTGLGALLAVRLAQLLKTSVTANGGNVTKDSSTSLMKITVLRLVRVEAPWVKGSPSKISLLTLTRVLGLMNGVLLP